MDTVFKQPQPTSKEEMPPPMMNKSVEDSFECGSQAGSEIMGIPEETRRKDAFKGVVQLQN